MPSPPGLVGAPIKWGLGMSIDTSNGHPAMDYAEHKRTYVGFIRFTQISIVCLVVLLIGMAVFLVQ